MGGIGADDGSTDWDAAPGGFDGLQPAKDDSKGCAAPGQADQ